MGLWRGRHPVRGRLNRAWERATSTWTKYGVAAASAAPGFLLTYTALDCPLRTLRQMVASGFIFKEHATVAGLAGPSTKNALFV